MFYFQDWLTECMPLIWGPYADSVKRYSRFRAENVCRMADGYFVYVLYICGVAFWCSIGIMCLCTVSMHLFVVRAALSYYYYHVAANRWKRV